MNDNKLNGYMAVLRDSDDIEEKVLNYKKANRRLDLLKEEYEELCQMMKQPSKKKKRELDLTTITEELNKLEESLNEETVDIRDVINKMMQYKMVLDNYDQSVLNLKNEISKVNSDKTLEKIDLDDL